jgi:hypothetical protein
MALLLRLEPAACLPLEGIEGGGEIGEYADGDDFAFETMDEFRVLGPLERAAGGRENESRVGRLFGWISEEGAGVGNDGDGMLKTRRQRCGRMLAAKSEGRAVIVTEIDIVCRRGRRMVGRVLRERVRDI